MKKYQAIAQGTIDKPERWVDLNTKNTALMTWIDGEFFGYLEIDSIKPINEPITVEALEANGWNKSNMRHNGYYKNNSNKKGNVAQIFVNLVDGVVTSAVIYFNDEDGTMSYPTVTKMSHLIALEEMFLQ